MIHKQHAIRQTGKITFFYIFIFTILICFFLPVSKAVALDQLLKTTPGDAEGPFYPIVRQADEDNNLLQVEGQTQTAQGDILLLSGRVIDERGRPYGNAVVEIWQTDVNGLYKDRRDRSPGKRDPYFQYWGKATCGEDGTYSFTTLVPGEYYPRPAHIHFKVWVNDSVRLTSQIYFKQQNTKENQKASQSATPDLLTVDLHKIDDGKYKAWFEIVL